MRRLSQSLSQPQDGMRTQGHGSNPGFHLCCAGLMV
jgi:hypothetical protein